MRYKIYASEVVYYVAEVDAESEEQAIDMAIDGNEWVQIDSTGWQTDKIVVESED